MKNKIITIIILIVLLMVPLILVMKFISRSQSMIVLDDVSPLINCNQDLMDKSEIYFVIPFYKNTKLTDYPEWCDDIKNSGKEMGLHGLHHTFMEMGTNLDEQLLIEALNDFEECFGKKPTKFRPPMWKINEYNKQLIERYGLDIMDEPFKTNTQHCNYRGIVFSVNILGD